MVHLPTLSYQDLPKLSLLTLSLPEPPRRLMELPPNWREEAGYEANHRLLADWLAYPQVLALGVPSAVVPASLNYLLHPQRPSYAQIEVLRTASLDIDPRLWQREPPQMI